MSDDPRAPRSAKLALDSLGGHPGWPIYCERFDQIVQREIDAKIFDPKSTDEERRTLVAARILLVGTYLPSKMRESMLAALRTEIQREAESNR
jgi:hypothetical protein